MSAKDSIATQTCELSKEEFNDFLTLYPIPSEYRVILPKSNQTIFDAPPGSEKHVPNLLPKVITRIEGWHERFFYVQDSIIPAKYSQLLSEQNKLDSKSFKDKLPPNIEENPMFQRLGRYPTSVRVFPDPILFLAGLKSSWEHGQQRPAILVGGKEMAFRNFIYTEDDEDLAFLPKEPSLDFGIGSPSVSINTEPLKANKEPEIQPVKVITDSGGSLKPKLSPVKRKLAPGSSTSRATRAKTSSSKDDAPFLRVSDDDDGLPDVLELKYVTACHLKISAITPLAWKNHLDNHIDLELLDLYDREFDVMKSRERVREEECKGLQVKCEAAMTEFEKNPAMVALREKISALSTEVKEHKLNLDRMMLKSQEWAGYQQSLSTLEREVISKVVPYVAMELIHSDDMGSLVGKLVSSVIVYGRCWAFEQVVDMKDPFDLSKVKGYRSSYKKDHTQANNDLSTTTFPCLDEFVADPSVLIKALLLKNPLTLQRPAPLRTHVPLPSSQRATPSSVPVSNPMSLPADASVMKPQSSQLH
ncbi:hypothetical protein Tco_0746555 [Tanacetum coccineum]